MFTTLRFVIGSLLIKAYHLLTISWFKAPRSLLSTPSATLESSSIASWRWRTTWTASWRAASSNSGSFVPFADLLPTDARKALVHSFVASRIDYCNAILYGVSDGVIRRMQTALNAAARLVVDAGRRQHMTPILQSLHWLPVKQRILYKIGILSFHCVRGTSLPHGDVFKSIWHVWPCEPEIRCSWWLCHTPNKYNDFRSAEFSCLGSDFLEHVTSRYERYEYFPCYV